MIIDVNMFKLDVNKHMNLSNGVDLKTKQKKKNGTPISEENV
jgi:hypothetical protein